MKQLYFVRHGESKLNVAGKWAGHTNTALTANGHEQAQAAGRKANAEGLQFDYIISSPLDRARQTALHIAAETGYPPDKIVFDPRLIERHYGQLEGQNHVSVTGARNLLDESHIEKYGAEKLTALQQRAEEILAELQQLPHERILVVGHGASGRALWRAVHKHPLKVRHKRYANAEIERLI